MSHDTLGDRMKAYEVASRTTLPGRLPVIIRVDGKAFHTYTKGTDRPFDMYLGDVMVDTAKKLCEEIQGAQLAYTQSDEISILVHGYKKFESQPWFDNQVQKMVSVAAGIASSHFTANSWKIVCRGAKTVVDNLKPAVFDARVFVLPEADVCNYFLWRQQDATRNSVQMLARSLYSHKQVENNNTSKLKEMCAEKGQPWDDLPTRWKRGVCVIKGEELLPIGGQLANSLKSATRTRWIPDYQIPVFSQDREYVNKYLAVEEE